MDLELGTEYGVREGKHFRGGCTLYDSNFKKSSLKKF